MSLPSPSYIRSIEFPNFAIDSHYSVNQSPAMRDRATVKQHDRAANAVEDVDGDTAGRERYRSRVYRSSSNWYGGRVIVCLSTTRPRRGGGTVISSARQLPPPQRLQGKQGVSLIDRTMPIIRQSPRFPADNGTTARPHQVSLHDERYADRRDECRCPASTHKIPRPQRDGCVAAERCLSEQPGGS